jgi:hypothetical protein
VLEFNMPKHKTSSKTLLGVDALINGELHHFNQLQWEFPSSPGAQPAELAPGLPGFYTISARGRSQTIRWMEECFASGILTIQIPRKPHFLSTKTSSTIITYSQPVESVREFPTVRFQDRLMGRLSASFGFYQASLAQKETQVRSRVTLAL